MSLGVLSLQGGDLYCIGLFEGPGPVISVSILAQRIVSTQPDVAGFPSGRKGDPCFLHGKEAGLLWVWWKEGQDLAGPGRGVELGSPPEPHWVDSRGASMADPPVLPGSLLPHWVGISIPS